MSPLLPFVANQGVRGNFKGVPGDPPYHFNLLLLFKITIICILSVQEVLFHCVTLYLILINIYLLSNLTKLLFIENVIKYKLVIVFGPYFTWLDCIN